MPKKSVASTKGSPPPKKVTKRKSPKKTQIVVKYDVGFSNTLFVRGSGGNLSWDRGIPMTNIGDDEWICEISRAPKHGEFKVLINDEHYESGENHPFSSGDCFTYTPYFE